MTIDKTMALEIQSLCNQFQDDYRFVGVRFEILDRQVGDTCDNSRHNPDRIDERDFPEFGTSEYNELPILDGTSCYHPGKLLDGNYFDDLHCYIIAGYSLGYEENGSLDDYEILIQSPKVVAKVF